MRLLSSLLSSSLLAMSTTNTDPTTVVIGLNGALQKRFLLPDDASSLIPGNVHRAAGPIQIGIGGKGQDVAISLSCLDYPNVQLAQFVGSGPGGDTVLSLLQERMSTELSIRTASPMRTCTTIVGTNESTELVELSGIVTTEEREALLSRLSSITPAAICIMGSMPPGLPSNMYATMYETMVEGNSPLCVIDSVSGLDEVLTAIGNNNNKKAAPTTILKINASELCQLAGVSKSSDETGGIAREELLAAIHSPFVRKYKAAALAGLALTDGKHAAHLVSFVGDCTKIYKLTPPSLDSTTTTLYPIGAGDSVAAGTLAAWKTLELGTGDLGDTVQAALDSRMDSSDAAAAATRRMEAAFAFGLSCGSASCLEEENSVFTVEQVLKLFQDIPEAELIE